jgi:hypothetical protein
VAVASSVPSEPINTGFTIGKVFAFEVIAPRADSAAATCITTALATLVKPPSSDANTGRICGMVFAVADSDPRSLAALA